MDEQLSLNWFKTKEEQTYANVHNIIVSVILKNFLGPEFLSFQACTGYWSITYANALIARIHFGKKVSYFAVDTKTAQPLLEEAHIPYDIKASDRDFVRIPLTEPEDIKPAIGVIQAVTQAVLDCIPKEFDCCSRFAQCSDAQKCIQPDDALRIGCGYRKIMASGKIFYGKNRNVD